MSVHIFKKLEINVTVAFYCSDYTVSSKSQQCHLATVNINFLVTLPLLNQTVQGSADCLTEGLIND